MRFKCGSCGQRYEADDSFAGENIKCVKCDAAISVPKIETDQKIPGKAVPPPVKKAGPEQAAPKLSMPSSFKKRMQERKDGDSRNCPNCSLPLLSEDAIMCIECGYNIKLGMNVNDLKK